MSAQIPRFTQRLRWAFENIPGPDGRPLTTERFVALLPEQGVHGVSISVSYGHQLRSGQKSNPTAPLLEAISRVFGLPQDYWWDDRVEAVIREGVAAIGDAARSARRRSNRRHLEDLVARLSEECRDSCTTG